MTSPVERLEAWCDRMKLPAPYAPSEDLKRLADSVGVVLTMHRITMANKGRPRPDWEAYREVVHLLADALNPEQEPQR